VKAAASTTVLQQRLVDALKLFVGKPAVYQVQSDAVDAVVKVLEQWDLEHGPKENGSSEINRLLAAQALQRHFGRAS
jgi:hypothetical protein